MTKPPKRPVIFVPSSGPDDWRRGLSDAVKHWKKGRSAYELAHSWEHAGGVFPTEVAATLATEPQLADLVPLVVIPEYKVPLVGGRRASQTDAFVVARGQNAGLATIAVEGKAGEDFGPVLSEWRREASEGKKDRERQLAGALGLEAIPGAIRYQLVHRAGSAILEAERFGARHAILLVHSFSTNDHFEDYEAFVALYRTKAKRGEMVCLQEGAERRLWAGWVDAPVAKAR